MMRKLRGPYSMREGLATAFIVQRLPRSLFVPLSLDLNAVPRLLSCATRIRAVRTADSVLLGSQLEGRDGPGDGGLLCRLSSPTTSQHSAAAQRGER